MADELHQELNRHAASLRGLARDLLRDSHAAEDVTQQTLEKAWSVRGKLQPGPLGGWLSRTLVNFTRQWQRGERRRTAREGERARLERSQHPSTAETLARREALQAVTTAVLQLEEPYQTAVFLRYFEDLPPRAIARRTDSNVATVKSRLARGLAMLRCRLGQSPEQQGRDWRPALAGAFGISIGNVLFPVTTGVLLVKTSLKITLLAAAVCIGGLMLYRGNDDPVPPASSDTEVGTKAAASPAIATQREAPPVPERTEATPTDIAEPWLTHSYELELEITVLDELGLPVEGFRPELAPPGGTLRNAAEATDANGKSVVHFASRQPRVDIDVLDPRRHRRKVTLQHGRRTQLTLIGEARQLGTVFWLSNMPEVARQLPNAKTSDKLQAGLHPHAVFSEPGLVVANPSPEPQSSLAGWSFSQDTVSALAPGTWQLDRGFLNRVDTATTKEEPKPAGGIIEGTVYGTTGKPVAGVPVMLLGSGPQALHHTKTDLLGHFRFDKLLPNTFQVRAGGDHNGLATLPVHVDKGISTASLHLRRDACIRGSLHDALGEPIAEATIEWHAADGSWADRTKTDEHGSFLLANLPGLPGQLVAWGKGGDQHFPIAHEAGVIADTGALMLVGHTGKGSSLRLLPQLPEGLEAHRLRIRARQLDTGFSRSIGMPRIESKVVDNDGKERKAAVDTPDQPWHVDQLPPGNYEVEVWLAGSGRLHLGRHWLDGKADCDLGNIVLPVAGRVRFDLPEDAQLPDGFEAEISSLRSTFDVRTETLRDFEHELLLEPGDYAFASRHAAQAATFRRFTVRSGQMTTVPVVW